MRQFHALTPGDHFSPRTGSAIATVVNGLAQHTLPRPAVLVAAGTYPDRYPSADPIEYELALSPYDAPRRLRAFDAAVGRAGLRRPWAGRIYRQVIGQQQLWEPSYILGHNAPQLMPLVSDRHAAVLYAHNDLLDWYSEREADRVLRAAHRIICVSAYTAQRISDKVPRLQDRVRVVHNGVDLAQFSSARSPHAGLLHVGYVGRVIPDKGVHVLMEAVSRLGRSDIGVVVVGSSGFSAGGPLTSYERELRRVAEDIPGGVRFVPFVPRTELPRILAQFEVVVVPSVASEAFPLTVLESMAAGAAVVASRIGGVPEAAGEAAQLVTPGDVDELAQAINALADSPKLVEEAGARGKARAARRTWSLSAKELAGALE